MKLIAYYPDRRYGLGSPARSKSLELLNGFMFCMAMLLFSASSVMSLDPLSFEGSIMKYFPLGLLIIVQLQDLASVTTTPTAQFKTQTPVQGNIQQTARFIAYICLFGSVLLFVGTLSGGNSTFFGKIISFLGWLSLTIGLYTQTNEETHQTNTCTRSHLYRCSSHFSLTLSLSA